MRQKGGHDIPPFARPWNAGERVGAWSHFELVQSCSKGHFSSKITEVCSTERRGESKLRNDGEGRDGREHCQADGKILKRQPTIGG